MSTEVTRYVWQRDFCELAMPAIIEGKKLYIVGLEVEMAGNQGCIVVTISPHENGSPTAPGESNFFLWELFTVLRCEDYEWVGLSQAYHFPLDGGRAEEELMEKYRAFLGYCQIPYSGASVPDIGTETLDGQQEVLSFEARIREKVYSRNPLPEVFHDEG